MRTTQKMARDAQRGFSLIEVLVATIVLMVGVVSLAQVVPAAVDLNQRSLATSQSLVVAERELEQMVRQPLSIQTSTIATDYNFIDLDGQSVFVGALPLAATALPGAAAPAAVQHGCPLVNNQIDFTQACAVPGYVKTVVLAGRRFEVRWNVITVYGNNLGTVQPVNKRIAVAANTSVRSFTPQTLTAQVAN
ncbi:MAG: prepilin-type N-terminal cleavage/methylation domain-containing protein [Acidobacteriia bacterium]|nr:prepilin-type N-terminal cleavage/methylation domain-containing protein [Terriglobia bacterium]